MRVGFVGAGGSGKTTVLELVAAKRPDIPVLRSPVRQVFERFGLSKESDQDGLDDARLWKLQRAIFEERKRLEVENFVSDRTLVDHTAYCLIRCHRAMTDDDVRTITFQMVESMMTYDHVFFFERLPTSRPDGFREAKDPYDELVDVVMRGLLQKHAIRHTTLSSGFSAEHRAAAVDWKIRQGPPCVDDSYAVRYGDYYWVEGRREG